MMPLGPRRRERLRTGGEISLNGLGLAVDGDGRTLMVQDCYVWVQAFMEPTDEYNTDFDTYN
jgi:hypothetical protein